jgi:5-methylcytosine-specific restriction endonuclease McrA
MGALTGALVVGVLTAFALLAWRYRGAGPRSSARPRRESLAERVRHEVWRRDGAACVDCGSRARLEFDHIIPVSRGGSNTARNIELRCEPCNRRKGARV